MGCKKQKFLLSFEITRVKLLGNFSNYVRTLLKLTNFEVYLPNQLIGLIWFRGCVSDCSKVPCTAESAA